MTNTFAIIPTTGRECVYECVAAIGPQVDEVILVHTGSDPLDVPTLNGTDTGGLSIIEVEPDSDRNISVWWNLGLDEVVSGFARRPDADWKVAILNDDAIVSPHWFQKVAEVMDETGAAAGCSGPHTHLIVEPGPVPLHLRMTGFAFMLRGNLGLRAHESLHWYFTDDYIDWESRKLGGMAMTASASVAHLHPNGQLTPELHQRIAEDAQVFFDLYGQRPW